MFKIIIIFTLGGGLEFTFPVQLPTDTLSTIMQKCEAKAAQIAVAMPGVSDAQCFNLVSTSRRPR